ncbi:MAG: FtsX-like permease family protein, partial [Arenicella sp.]|nr:FtsX-like permease family protein [Arenicella sp.]
MNTTLILAWRNLWRHQRRTWLTVGAMVFSNILLVFMITLQFGSYDMMIENSLKAYSGHVQVAAQGYNEQTKMRLALDNITGKSEQIRQANPKLSVAARSMAFVLASSETRSFGLQVAGVEVEHETAVSSIPGLVKSGRYLIDGNAGEIVIGRVLARNLQSEVGDEITLLGSGYDGSFAAAVVKVVGIFESGISEIDRSLAQLNLDEFQTLFAMGDRGHTIIVNAPDISETQHYQNLLEGTLNANGTTLNDLEILNWEQLNPGLRQAIQSDMASAWFMYAVLIVLVAFSVLNTQLMSVLERTREFGIMTAIGLRPGKLGRLVLLETTVMATLGFVIGCLLGAAVAVYF